MPRERMNILDPLGLHAGSGSAADAATEGDPHTGHLPLERPQHQLAITVQVETRPVQVFDLAVQKGGKLCGVGDEVTLTGKQGLQLRSQQAITRQPRSRRIQIDHVCCSNSLSPTQ